MAKQVVTTAILQCTFGAAPSVFSATPKNIKSGMQDAGHIFDNKPMVNIKPFGVCSCPAFPATATATTAAAGVLTPMPCIPNTAVGPWAPGSPTAPLNMIPALNDTSKLMCMWGGVISVNYPGQVTEDIP